MPTKETFQGIWLNTSGFIGYVLIGLSGSPAFRIASRLILFLWDRINNKTIYFEGCAFIGLTGAPTSQAPSFLLICFHCPLLQLRKCPGFLKLQTRCHYRRSLVLFIMFAPCPHFLFRSMWADGCRNFSLISNACIICFLAGDIQAPGCRHSLLIALPISCDLESVSRPRFCRSWFCVSSGNRHRKLFFIASPTIYCTCKDLSQTRLQDFSLLRLIITFLLKSS